MLLVLSAPPQARRFRGTTERAILMRGLSLTLGRVIQFSEVGEFRVYSHLVINDFEGRGEYDRFVSSLDRSVG